MQKVNYLYKNCGIGKTAAICSLVYHVSFKSKNIYVLAIKQYIDYLLNYLKYDNVYIIADTLKQVKIEDTNIFKMYEGKIKYGIDDINFFNKLNIDDLFLTQNLMVFFGGILNASYIYQMNNIVKWYNDNKKIFLIQDDPALFISNPGNLINQRLFINKNLKINIANEAMQYYINNSNKLNDIFDNKLIIAYCGYDYLTYYNRLINLKSKIQLNQRYYDNFNCYNYQGMNDNLDNKLINYNFDLKKYDHEYHGYHKTRINYRIKILEKLFKNLNNFLLISNKKLFTNLNNYDYYEDMNYYNLLQFINKNAKSTLIIADDLTFDSFVTPRFFDCMLSDIIAFIYTPYDSKKILVNDDFLKDFIYVDNPQDFVKKVNMISNNKELYYKIKMLQRKSTYELFNEFCNDKSKIQFETFLNIK